MATRKTPSKTAPKAPAKSALKPAAKPAVQTPKPPATAKPRAADTRTSKTVATAATAAAQPVSVAIPAGEERYRWIAQAAYLRAEGRGFAPGQEVEDWLAAEAEFLAAFGPDRT